MRRAAFHLLLVNIIMLFILVSCASKPEIVPVQDSNGVRPSPLPQPTLHWQSEGAEHRNKKARKSWMEQMHRAAPGVDWRRIELENGLRELDRRNRLTLTEKEARFGPRWEEVGSNNQAGRMHCTWIGPDGESLYGGSSLGGLWRGSLDGFDWEPLGDNLFGGVHELVVAPGENPGDPDVVLAATDGGMVHVSRDYGATWESPQGLPGLNYVRGVALLDDPSSTILVYGSRQGAGGPAVFASTDLGRTFSMRWQGSYEWTGWMWVPRVGPGAQSTVYLLHRGRLRKSIDGGFDCPVLSVIDENAERGVLTGCEAGAPTLYAALLVSGQWKLYRSDNGGVDWTHTHDIADFWESLCASTLDPNRVIYGGVEAFRSIDGGIHFDKINNWGDYYGDPVNKLHADLPGIHCWPDPIDPFAEYWYFSTDGGVFLSEDGGVTVHNLSQQGLGVSQYYSTHTSINNPDLILAGSQDQGYQRGFRQEGSGTGPSTPFDQLISGDYGHLTSSDGTHQLVYSVYPGFILVQEGENNPSLLYPWIDFPTGSSHAWLPPIAADPLDRRIVYFCGEKLYKFTRQWGAYWKQSIHSTQDFTAGGGQYLSALAFSEMDPQRVYAVTNAGVFFYSTDHGVNWTQAQSGAPPQHYFYGNAIAVHPDNPLEAAVGGSGYSSPGVLRTLDGGQTWFPETNGLPQTLVYSLTYAEDTGDLYAGCETGALRWDRKSRTWENILAPRVPITIYWSVESVEGGTRIRFGTYGRGIWDYFPHPQLYTGPATISK